MNIKNNSVELKFSEFIMNDILKTQTHASETRAWALWKATFELSQVADKNSLEAEVQK